jgi:hypothetical protein
MTLSVPRIRHHLKNFELEKLFIEELGWDRHSGALIVTVDGQSATLHAIAQKRGVQIFECAPSAEGRIPDYATRRKIEKQVTKSAHEHLIIFVDAAKTTQVWQWVSRLPSQPVACREHHYDVAHHSGDPLIQKLSSISFSLSEEESLDLTGAVRRLRDAFDRDKLTKRFYDHFKAEHAAFLEFIKGITATTDREWYASLMLNRLMFVYFIQQKGFLDGDRSYLQNRLKMVQARKGKGKFLTFFRYFLLRLFHEGFGKQPADRAKDLDELLGKVPYLDGGLFEEHELEQKYPKIDVPDEAFEKLFAFFDQWSWHLDERPLREDREINPDVLGYIFEKYINQKQMGAYYTKEDITEYIGKNTVISYLFDAAQKKCAVAFEPGSALWRLLKQDPDRYIYEPVRRGVIDAQGKVIPESALPDFVQKGMHDPKARMFERRYNLNEADLRDNEGRKLTLPTETWREYVNRRSRCLEVRDKLARGEIAGINDFITYNLDIRQFAEDVISNCEGPELLRAFYRSIAGHMPQKSNEKYEPGISILDPTCGSGAFLFAALNILEPLYEACLDRMQAFVDDLDRSGERHRPEKFADFRAILAEVEKHPSRRYFILKSIVVNNLYGVDIMEEAVEICKLRLFLKLVAQVDKVEQLEPLPDIDFNIRPGNTLVGFVSLDDVKKSMEGDMLKQMELPKIQEEAEIVERAFEKFHQMQTRYGMNAKEFAAAKQQLRTRLKGLAGRLDEYLASEYGKEPAKKKAYEEWRSSHQPFHWFAEFYGIMSRGGFDVIIGNPPYLEQSQVSYLPRGLVTANSKAVHAMCIERSLACLTKVGSISMIVPLALVSTQRMQVVQRVIERDRSAWYANFSWRPGKLFDTVNRALTIFVARGDVQRKIFSTNYRKWNSDNRPLLFPTITYSSVPNERRSFWAPKLGQEIERGILSKIMRVPIKVSNFITRRGNAHIYHRTTGGLYWKVFTDFPPAFRINGKKGSSSRETSFSIDQKQWMSALIALLSSDLFWWWYTVTSNLRDLNPADIQGFPVPKQVLEDKRVKELGEKYISDIKSNSTMLVREQRQTGRTETQCFRIQLSKPIIDRIDHALSKHYGFDDEELDFIINYDIKYRMGRVEDDEE